MRSIIATLASVSVSKVSVNARLVTGAPPPVLLMMNTSVLVEPGPMVSDGKKFLTNVGAWAHAVDAVPSVIPRTTATSSGCG